MRSILPLAALVLIPVGVSATPAPLHAQHAVDLAGIVAGTYEGDVVADTRGGSQSGVVITVKRVAKNLVEISCDYPRVPTVQIALTAASDAIIAARPGNGFLIERAKDPRRLDLSIDGVTLIVHKR